MIKTSSQQVKLCFGCRQKNKNYVCVEKKKDIQRMRGENKCLHPRRFFTFIACWVLAPHVLDIYTSKFIHSS